MSAAKTSFGELDKKCAQTIRFLACEGVQKAKSGHPGMPMGMAAPAYVLWKKHMQFNPSDPRWLNRDRFVLSAGHGSMLIYSLLYLFGYDMSLDDLKNFRQWASKTPGHPEYEPHLGIETTTGPLGQGIANAVGMAIEQKYLAALFNEEKFPIFDYNIFTISGDGCLQEGVSGEACSLAGHLQLDNLIVLYDDNSITIDGETSLSFTEDVKKRYEAYGWKVIEVPGDGDDLEALDAAIKRAKRFKGKPVLLKIKSHIAYGSPNKQDTEGAHGSPLGDDEIKLMKQNMGWDPEKSFDVDPEVLAHTQAALEKGKKKQASWQRKLKKYRASFPEKAQLLDDVLAGGANLDLNAMLPSFETGSSIATRSASGKVLNTLMPKLPFVMGGSADLTPSNNTHFEGAEDFQADNPSGRYLRFGVREHAMGAIMNGISAGGVLRAYGGTFLVFSDYMRGAVRVAALSKFPSIFVWTHDSIGVGEDGPTHQPVEHAASLRAIPNLVVFRPADANETAQAWRYALEHKDAPTALLLTREKLPVMDPESAPIKEGTLKGAYALCGDSDADVVILATGSQVQLAMQAAESLETEGTKVRVVSMPSWELFEKQSDEYKNSVMLPQVKARVAVEAGVELGWRKYIGENGVFVGMSSFGASAPGGVCFEKFGITADAVVDAAKSVVE